MSDEDVSTMAKLQAERLMRGENVTDSEMRIVTAGLMLAVDELARAVKGLKTQLWPEAKLRQIIGEEIEKHCAAKIKACSENSGFSATWIGRLVRSIAGFK